VFRTVLVVLTVGILAERLGDTDFKKHIKKSATVASSRAAATQFSTVRLSWLRELPGAELPHWSTMPCLGIGPQVVPKPPPSRIGEI
jgi:hypothetical protein